MKDYNKYSFTKNKCKKHQCVMIRERLENGYIDHCPKCAREKRVNTTSA